MKKLLNTLYVTTENASLRKDGENLVAEIEGAERARVPLHMLGSLVTFGAIFLCSIAWGDFRPASKAR